MKWSRYSNPTEAFRLQTSASTSEEARSSQYELPKGVDFIGLVVNPKLKQLVFATTDGTYVGIRSSLGHNLLLKLGEGYYDDGDDEAARLSDYPRVHTPSGVVIKGAGYGTSLYAALCLGAHQYFDGNHQDLTTDPQNDGVSSREGNRSGPASAWWDRATELGLAQRKEYSKTETEENVDISGDVSAEELSQIAGRTVTYVNTVRVDTEEETTEEVDVYDFDEAESNHLVVAGFATTSSIRTIRDLWEAMRDNWDPEDVDENALLALDVRGLDQEVIFLLSVLYRKAGLSESAVDALRFRWQNNLDPGVVAPEQFRLWPNPAGEGMREVVLARQRTRWNRLESLP